ncbi:OmpH family outer membrane protein [Kitasatospora sp. NPDC059088]|uniref:OmpH family outer membrane protein n=1 Tax=Kitasatospora sp. NPDC059088 TaxID=3346722 RepID=UPI003686806B
MSNFPDGNFTIVNSETGRCVRVRLGKTEDVSDHKEGTKYLQYVTKNPSLELGPVDNSPATAWWFGSSNEQVVSFPVGEYQNIGNYCVWMHSNLYVDAKEELDRYSRAFAGTLNSMSEDLKKKFAGLIPEDFKAEQARRHEDMVKMLMEVDAKAAEALRARMTASWAAEDLVAWHRVCADVACHAAGRHGDETVPGPFAYLAAAAEEGIRPPAEVSDPTALASASTYMRGCGADRSEDITYRWTYDGTYIYGADSKTVPSERTYWTDKDGSLVGKTKGGPGQTWTIAPWTPTPPPAKMDAASALMLTGLYGPVAVFKDIFGV